VSDIHSGWSWTVTRIEVKDQIDQRIRDNYESSLMKVHQSRKEAVQE